ncbi:MAG: hypothetical protein J6D47_17195 [Peptostreptococcaceae bacterium]|nr:hypothetical protein [Peptostreptococcaceae bacterium]
MRKYTITEMKKLNSSVGYHYFDKETMKFFNSKIEGTYNNGLFIDSIDNFDGTKRIYKVKIFTENYNVCNLEDFPTLNCAREYIKTLNKALKYNLGNREIETLNNVTYVRCNEDSDNEYLEFINDNNNGVSHSFTLNKDLQVVG